MKKKTLKNIVLTVLIISAAFLTSLGIYFVFDILTLIPSVFVLGVFLVSSFTEGYIYGIVASIVSVLAVNYAFDFPYFSFCFSAAENIVSAVIMLVVALVIVILTTGLRDRAALKAESEKECMRANLLRAVSHDMRTPLTTIYGSSSAIIDNYESFSDEQKIKLLCGIKEDSEWLTGMVENLLSVTRLDSGNVELNKSPIVLDELIDAVLRKFSGNNPQIPVRLEMPDDFVIVPMDPLLIQQVLFNILNNAVSHARGMTEIYFRVLVEDKKAVFEISDNGCGIAPERLKGIFTGIHGSSAVPTDTKRNSGIGLSVCATIIKAHGGEITAENKRRGGAVFRFTLDIEEADYE